MQRLTIAVLGLGYVGLPLAVEFARHHRVLAFDTNLQRIEELRQGRDRTREVSGDQLRDGRLRFTADPAHLGEATVFIIAVPTPVDKHKRPDLGPLLSATRTVAPALKTGDVVVYESTVYPGCTEEDCVPVLECESGLRFNSDFTVGYSPERINPGDTQRRLPDVVKIVSGSTPETTDFLCDFYGSIVTAGIHRASSIRVAEAAKVIENTQRDVNIALVNELAVLFNRLGLDTHEVLEAAGTKWNFLPFTPGLVGGHCIGVDPYYLTHKALEVGYQPEVILAGRRINDSMGTYVADRVVLLMTAKGIRVGGSRVLVLGLAFKENCPDTKNTRVVDIVGRLEQYGAVVDVVDPWVDPADAKGLGVDLVELDAALAGEYDGAVLAVAHREFEGRGHFLRLLVGDGGVMFDAKGSLGDYADDRL
jgi:UDP-N-acetyl-D-galactosamine dehydrogenase